MSDLKDYLGFEIYGKAEEVKQETPKETPPPGIEPASPKEEVFEDFMKKQPDFNPNEKPVQDSLTEEHVAHVHETGGATPPLAIPKLPTSPITKETKENKKTRKRVFWKAFAIISLFASIIILSSFVYSFNEKDFNKTTEIVNNPPINDINIAPENTYTHEITNNIEIFLDDEFVEDLANRIFEQVNESLNIS